MTALGGPYRVDLDALLSHIEDCEAFGRKVEGWLSEIDVAVARLHMSWSGDAATEQLARHAQEVKGLQEMRDGLAKLHDQAQSNHESYSGVVEHQRGMWP